MSVPQLACGELTILYTLPIMRDPSSVKGRHGLSTRAISRRMMHDGGRCTRVVHPFGRYTLEKGGTRIRIAALEDHPVRPDGGSGLFENWKWKGEAKARGRASAAAATVFGLIVAPSGTASANTGSHWRGRHDVRSVGRVCTRSANHKARSRIPLCLFVSQIQSALQSCPSDSSIRGA